MSFSDKPSLTGWQKLGCPIYLIVASFIVAILMIGAVLADCASESCMPDWQRLMLFPGSLAVAIIGGAILTKFFLRDRD